MKLVMHLGLHRAGSTAIQDWLLAERPGWEAEGTFVHARPSSGGTPSPFAILTQAAAIETDPAQTAKFLDAALIDLSDRFVSGIVSDENLLGAMPAPRVAPARRGDFLCAVFGGLSKVHDITTVIVLRDHLGWLRSLYRTYLSRGGTRDFKTFCAAVPASAARFAPLLRSLEGNSTLVVLDYSDLSVGNGQPVVAALAAALGRSPTQLELPLRNAAFSDLHLRIASLLGRYHAVLAGHGGTAMVEAAAASDGKRLAEIVAERAVHVNWKATPAARMRSAGRLHRVGTPVDRRVVPDICRAVVAEAIAAGPLDFSPDGLPLDEFASDRQTVALNWLPRWRKEES